MDTGWMKPEHGYRNKDNRKWLLCTGLNFIKLFTNNINQNMVKVNKNTKTIIRKLRKLRHNKQNQ